MQSGPGRWASRAPLVVGVGLMALIGGVHAARLADETVRAARRLVVETPEERRVDAYGVCSARGYGYVNRVIARFPDPDAVPVIRYHGFDRFGALVLPFERRRLEERVLVGINLRSEDLAEQAMPCRRLTRRATTSSWLFRADTTDVDTLVGFRVSTSVPGGTSVPSASSVPRSLTITLYDTPQRRHELGRWRLTIPSAAGTEVGGGTEVRIPDLRPFSVHNRSVGFLIDVDGADVSALDLLAIPVDARGYVPVHRDGGCTTAVRSDLMPDLRATAGPWRDWLNALESRP